MTTGSMFGSYGTARPAGEVPSQRALHQNHDPSYGVCSRQGCPVLLGILLAIRLPEQLAQDQPGCPADAITYARFCLREAAAPPTTGGIPPCFTAYVVGMTGKCHVRTGDASAC